MTNEAAAVRAYDLRRFLCRRFGDTGNSSPQVSHPLEKSAIPDPSSLAYSQLLDF